jgi:hypothetical protein
MATIEISTYRVENLAMNNIYMRPRENFPKHIDSLLKRVNKDRVSLGPSSKQIENDTELHTLENGASEAAVRKYFGENIFPNLRQLSNGLKLNESLSMLREIIPDAENTVRVSTPMPDMLFGYKRDVAFSWQQQRQILNMGSEMLANKDDMMYPFFVVEFKGDGATGSGSLWVATNQCLGGVASCVNIAERLNRRLRASNFHPIDSVAFSIAMNGTEARLFVAWKDDDDDERPGYYMQKIKTFSLQEPGQYLAFRKYVRNIIDWGNGQHLEEIRRSLDSLWGESHPPPPEEPVVGGRPKRKAAKRVPIKAKARRRTKA